MIQNVIIIAVLAVIIALAVFYVYKSRKNGAKCIGCPYGKSCNGSCHSYAEHHSDGDAEKE